MMSLNRRKRKPKSTKKGMTLAAKFAKELNLMDRYVRDNSGVHGPAIHRLDYIRHLSFDQALTVLKSIVSSDTKGLLEQDFDFPQNFKVRSEVRSANLERGSDFEISFLVTQFLGYAEELKEFLRLKEEFESYFLIGNYEQSEILLNEIKLKFGFSVWYITSSFNLSYQQGKIEEIRDNIREIDALGGQKVDALGPLGYAYLRVDNLVSYERYAFSLEGQKEALRLHGSDFHADFIDFEFLYSPENKIEYIENLVLEISTYCVVDRYLALRRLMIHLTIHNVSLSNSMTLIRHLNDFIQDKILSNLIEVDSGNKSPLSDDDVRYVHLCESYMEGKYGEVVSLCESWLVNKPTFTLCVEMYAKSLFRLDRESSLKGLLGDVVNLIVSLYKDDVKDEIIEKLQKIQLRFINDEWSQFIRVQVRKYLPQKTLNEIEYLYSYINIIHSIKHPYSSFPLGREVDIECKASKSLMNCQMKAFGVEEVGFSSVGRDRYVKLKADYLFKDGEFEKAKRFYRELLDSEDSLFRVHANSKVMLCDFYDGNVKDALKTVSELIVTGVNPREVPVEQAAKEILKDHKRSTDLSYLMDKAIVLFSYHGLGLENVYHQVTLICENIFDLLGIESVDGIEFYAGDFRFKYFLENVLCTEVLEAHESFFEIEDYFLFRVLLLQRMIDEKYFYTTAVRIKSILLRVLEKLVKETCSLECGAGKVEVDSNSLSERLSAELEVGFNKLTDFDEASFNGENEDAAEWNETKYLMSKNEEHIHLTELHRKVRDAYMIDPVYGLDHFLNMNIRHGVISNHLRAPILSNKLQVILSEDNRKIVNKYIGDPYVLHSDSERKRLADALYDFNLEAEQLIGKVKNWMRVDTGEVLESEFLFKLEFSSGEINELGKKALKMRHVSEFVDESIKLLNFKVDWVLEYIKEEMLGQVAIEFDHLFVKFFDSLDGTLMTENLSRSIRVAQQEVKKQIEELSGWMAWKNESSKPFFIASALREAEEVAKKLHPGFSFKLIENERVSSQLKGEFFRKFVTIFLILIDNAIKHSGLKGLVEINVSFKNQSGHLEIYFENKFSKDYRELMIEKVERLTIMLEEGCIEKASGESGSGIFKIKKILKYDLDLGDDVCPVVDEERCVYRVVMKVGDGVFYG